MIENSAKIRLQNNALNQIRKPKPDHIHHPSRRNTTFSMKQHWHMALQLRTPRPAIPTRMQASLSFPRARIYLERPPRYPGKETEYCSHPGTKGFSTTGDVQPANQGIATGAPDLLLTRETCDETITSTDDSDDIDSIEHGKGKPLTRPGSFDILSWYEKVSDSAPAPLPLTHGSFERGVIGGLC